MARFAWLVCGWLFWGAANAGSADPSNELELGAGIARSPDYSGSATSVTQLRLWVNGTYLTPAFGTLSVDSGSLTIDPELRWDFVDSGGSGLGVLIGYRPGRSDTKPGFASFGSGSVGLKGLPDVPGAVDFGVQAYVSMFGLPIFAQVRSAVDGTQGALINLGAVAAFSVGGDTELTVLPTVTWADARQMRAFYGVGQEASASTGFASYEPGAGWENAALEISADWRIRGAWHLVGSIAGERLLGGAAGSPIVEKRNQVSGLIGVAWHY